MKERDKRIGLTADKIDKHGRIKEGKQEEVRGGGGRGDGERKGTIEKA